jgi:hypothetical protein
MDLERNSSEKCHTLSPIALYAVARLSLRH